MGRRNNNGSLFYQLLNAPGLMERQDLSQPVSFQTRENYFNWCHKAAAVFKSYGIRNLSEIGKDEIQRYENQLEAEGKSASTIHNYLVPICKATGIAIKDIRKPIRASSEFKRSAGKGRGDGGKPAELNKFLGLREGDLKRLRGDSLIYKTAIVMSSLTKARAVNIRSNGSAIKTFLKSKNSSTVHIANYLSPEILAATLIIMASGENTR